MIPEFVVNRWYTQILHNQTALALKARLLFRPNTVVTSVPDPAIGRTRRPESSSGRGDAVRDAVARHVLDGQADPHRQAHRPRRRSTTSGSASSSPCRSSPPTPSRPPPTRRTRSCSCSLVQAGIGARPANVPRADRHRRLRPAGDRGALSYRQTIYAYPSGGGAYIVSPGEPRRDPVAGRRRVAAHRLHPHRRGVGRRRRAGHPVRRSGSTQRWTVPICLLLHRRDDGGQPARPEGVGGAVRPADVLLHRHADAADRRSASTGSSSSDLGPIPLDDLSPEAQELRHGTTSRSRSSCCCGRSRRAPSRCRASRRCPTACPRSASRRRATRPTTLASWARSSARCFLGVSILAAHLQPYRGENDPTGIALMAEYIYGGKGVLFWITQIATFAILILAANTAYADFPRLSSIIARDGFLPRQFANRGDRLVFSNGIIFLAVVAGVLIIVFKGNISRPDPALRVRRVHRVHAQPGRHGRPPLPAARSRDWRLRSAINGVGCVATGVVALVVVVSKFTEGAWIPAVLIPSGRRPSDRSAGTTTGSAPPCRSEPDYRPPRHTHYVVVLVGTVNKGVHRRHQLRPLAGARPADRRLGRGRRRGAGASSSKAWAALRHPDRAAHHLLALPRADPARARLPRRARRRGPDDIITVVIPEFVTRWTTPVAAQPVGVRPEGPPAVPPEHRRDVGPGARGLSRGSVAGTRWMLLT